MKKALLVLAALVTALVSTGTAAADPGAGATVTNDSYCQTTFFSTVCLDVKLVTKTTTSPSGKVSYVTNGTTTTTTTFAFSSCSQVKTTDVHLHWLRHDAEAAYGEEQSFGERRITTTAFACGSFAQTCVSTFELHMTNGEVQFQRPEFVCTTA